MILTFYLLFLLFHMLRYACLIVNYLLHGRYLFAGYISSLCLEKKCMAQHNIMDYIKSYFEPVISSLKCLATTVVPYLPN